MFVYLELIRSFLFFLFFFFCQNQEEDIFRFLPDPTVHPLCVPSLLRKSKAKNHAHWFCFSHAFVFTLILSGRIWQRQWHSSSKSWQEGRMATDNDTAVFEYLLTGISNYPELNGMFFTLVLIT